MHTPKNFFKMRVDRNTTIKIPYNKFNIKQKENNPPRPISQERADKTLDRKRSKQKRAASIHTDNVWIPLGSITGYKNH